MLLMLIPEAIIGQLTKIGADTTVLNKMCTNEHVPLSGGCREVKQNLNQEKKMFYIKKPLSLPS